MRIFLTLVLITISSAEKAYLEPDNTTSLPKTTSCYQGSNGVYNEQHCAKEQEMCITSVVIAGSTRTITKSCIGTEACLAEQRNSYKECNGFDFAVTSASTCHICCVGANCNFMNENAELAEAHKVIADIKVGQ